jgi:hypothetical protein
VVAAHRAGRPRATARTVAVMQADKNSASGGTSGSRMDRAKRRKEPFAGLGFGRVVPSPSARRRLADHPRPVQVVRPAGRSTCTGRERPAPRKVADSDGMTRPGRACAYAPRKTIRQGTGKAQKSGGVNDRADR